MNLLPRYSRDFYAQETTAVAQSLLGSYLVVEHPACTQVGRVVETEAYLGPIDLAAHSSRGVTPRTQVMFGPPGHAYVYLIYGMYHCFNVVTEPEGSGTAVLIRALEPVHNLDLNASGPGRLCKALSLNLMHNTQDLCDGNLYLCPSPDSALRASESIQRAPRIGVDSAGDWASKPLRFLLSPNTYVSKPLPKRSTPFTG
ncbi:DNA-3-methyladenine glycosylase [Paenalcaligenes niemegkensis]|uniref:DNA-3-methyladenine glycosylase n=1 Tax=Paenalcaligenes niemegkensis TaxID=2895469 RepID=UPI001EE81F2C|nr:DNA-3-methyladenine glycosylase [Paenalcaligenes niemegkensis]MCQ9615690.1 DNA-3-methyladenine glycosylase [Paenalcaligenes niemegkensis]